ncbi:DUF262 domain-containing protein [Parabacteroides sp. FAFU027]|uniref:DUF262 domain-containing protein n=1 Tax=Parabacteroides sp. FAFU027 TaxID=2922715 RepID=UPI001FAE9700|nr:DUF262 domain-containing protein [Parabacteroides sp. FAFU027]
MNGDVSNKITLSDNSLEHLSQELPTEVIDKLANLKDQIYHRYDDFKSILHGLLGDDNYTMYKDIILNFIEQVETDEDTLDSDETGKGSIYPYDPSKADIDIREDPQTIYELVIRKWDRNLIEMPDFQRKYVWKPEQQCLFIESILLNFPLPPLYINKDKNGKYMVVDGRQRITTLRRYLKNEFRLDGLKAIPSVNGKNFTELIEFNSDYQTKIEDKKLLVYLIQPSVPLEMVYDIFNRINTGGTQLERQEIRNCIYIGKATKFLKNLSAKSIFKEAIDYGISDDRAKDQEAILRYLSFRMFDYNINYKYSMNDFVEDAMKHMNEKFSDEDFVKHELEFEKAMHYTLDFFDKRNFRIPTEETRGRINIAIFETVAGFFASRSEEYLLRNKAQIKANYTLLLRDSLYFDAVRFSTGDKKRVSTRFDRVFDILSKDCTND